MKIETIDRNFAAKTIDDTPFLFRSVTEKPFSLEGFAWKTEFPNDPFRRIPERLRDGGAEAAVSMTTHTTGAAVRFRTDSSAIAIRALLRDSCDMNHMPRGGSAGFDLYTGHGADSRLAGMAYPNPGETELVRKMLTCKTGQMQEYQLNFPLYGGASSVEIGLLPDSRLESPAPHKVKKPILFYGSSITQGGCASRPGNAYTTMLCRALDAEQINLGFSGSAKGEPAMAELIAEPELAAFVMDYDHNAPTLEHLRQTHEPFFKIVRAKRPDLPILLISRCNIWADTEEFEEASARREIVRRTWKNAVAAGDRRVWFVDGELLFGKRNRHDCTVDNCHPNDLGFYRMFKHILPVLKEALR